jgi:ribose/xylose/arabinose/galactoside ABC-type transport system permease subunit
MIALFFFLIILASSGWLVTRAGGNSFLVEGMLILSASLCSRFSSLFPVFKSTTFLFIIPVFLCGSVAGILAWLLQGGKRTSAIRLVAFDLGVHCLVFGSLFNRQIFISSFKYPLVTILCGVLSPLIVYSVLTHSAIGLKIRLGGTSSEVMRRFGFSVGFIQAGTFALAGMFAALAAGLKDFNPTMLFGYGYLAYVLLWGIRIAVAYAGAFAENNTVK